MILDKETIAQIKQETNIVGIIGEVVSLTKVGRNYLGLCPFHKEKTPSFNVIEEKQFYHCFGCGKSGDVFKFLETYRQVSFKDSVLMLADRLGITIENTAYENSRQSHPHEKLFQINQEAMNFFSAVLKTTKQGELARRYLYSRGLDDELIDYFQIGLAPQEKDYLYRSLSSKYDEEIMMNSGLFNISETNGIYDVFRHRIMFALTDDKGRIIGFSGRVWEGDTDKKQAKYKNTRTTPIFNKSYELYHLDKAKPIITKKQEVYLMEGFLDVIAAYKAGITNVVASMGTALTKEHVDHLKKVTKKVVLTYDGDSAGQQAIAKAIKLLSSFSVDVIKLPQGMDPNDYLIKNSAKELSRFLEHSRISQVEFWIDYLKPENLDNLQSEIAYVERISQIIAKEPSITAQNSYINKVADILPDFDYHQVEQTVNNIRLAIRKGDDKHSKEPIYFELPLSKKISALRRTENYLFHRMLHHAIILNDYRLKSNFHFVTPELEELYQLLLSSGEINVVDLSKLSEKTQQAYYHILEEQLPESFSRDEMIEVEKHRERLLAQEDMRKQSQLIRDTSNHGDQASALAALENLISQKRKIE